MTWEDMAEPPINAAAGADICTARKTERNVALPRCSIATYFNVLACPPDMMTQRETERRNLCHHKSK